MKRDLMFITLFLIFIIQRSFGLDFQVSDLVSIPGNNKNFDVLRHGFPYYESAYICWLNQTDSAYTIYIKQLDDKESENLVVYSDTCPNINPQIAINRFSQGIRILWQSKVNGHWQLLQRDLINDSLGQIISVTDSLSDNTEPALSLHRVTFINDGKLMIKAFYPECEEYYEPVIIDSGYCSNPDIYCDDDYYYAAITYEKGTENSKEIYRAEYSYTKAMWETEKISGDNTDNLNPRFILHPENITYQSYVNGFWTIVATGFGYSSHNTGCNYLNPDFLFYDVPIKGVREYSPCFSVFDTDSIENNQEIFIETFADYPNDTLMNISNLSGFDEKPLVIVADDSITILWEHTEDGKTDIWWAKEKFTPYPGGAVDDQNQEKPSSFLLCWNYPNPFNPSTTVVFQITKSISEKAVIKIYNTRGEPVRTIKKNINGNGYYSVFWDGKSDSGNNLPSGNYFYNIHYGHIVKAGKMCLIK